MSKIVVQSKLKELTGMSVDLGRGGMMNGNKLFLVVTDLCSNALSLTLPTIISNFNNTGVVRGCIILLPSKFEGRKQIELWTVP